VGLANVLLCAVGGWGFRLEVDSLIGKRNFILGLRTTGALPQFGNLMLCPPGADAY
jgi:hypothetical protein